MAPTAVPSAVTAEPAQAKPGARSGVGDGDGVGAGGPTVIAVAGRPWHGHHRRSADRLPNRVGVRDLVGRDADLSRRQEQRRVGAIGVHRPPAPGSVARPISGTAEHDPSVGRPGRGRRRAVGGEAADVGTVWAHRVDILLLLAPRHEHDPRPIRDQAGESAASVDGRLSQVLAIGVDHPEGAEDRRDRTAIVLRPIPEEDELPAVRRPDGTGASDRRRVKQGDPTGVEVHRRDRRRIHRVPGPFAHERDMGPVGRDCELGIPDAGCNASGVGDARHRAARIGEPGRACLGVQQVGAVR